MSTTRFKINDEVLQRAKDAFQLVKNGGKVYVHGDGQVYVKEFLSDSHKNFTNKLPGMNPPPHPATYVVAFNEVSAIPKTVKAMETLLEQSKTQEMNNILDNLEKDVNSDLDVLPAALPANKQTPTVDPKDAEIEDLRRQLAESKKGSQGGKEGKGTPAGLPNPASPEFLK